MTTENQMNLTFSYPKDDKHHRIIFNLLDEDDRYNLTYCDEHYLRSLVTEEGVLVGYYVHRLREHGNTLRLIGEYHDNSDLLRHIKRNIVEYGIEERQIVIHVTTD